MRKTILTCCLLVSVLYITFSQDAGTTPPGIPRLSKIDIGTSGCAAYLPAEMPEFNLEKSEDGADVYTSEIEIDSFVFGCIAVKFVDAFTDSSPDDLEALLISYMEYLKEAFEITGAVGYGKGHTMESAPDARGVIDYWEDDNGNEYAVKGWINQKYLGFLYIGGAGEYPHFNLQQMYLDGFRFGE